MAFYLERGDLLERVNALVEENNGCDIYIIAGDLQLLSEIIYLGIRIPGREEERRWLDTEINHEEGYIYWSQGEITYVINFWLRDWYPSGTLSLAAKSHNLNLDPKHYYFVHPGDIFQGESLSSFIGSFSIQMALDNYRLMILIMNENKKKNPLATKLPSHLRRLLFTYLT